MAGKRTAGGNVLGWMAAGTLLFGGATLGTYFAMRQNRPAPGPDASYRYESPGSEGSPAEAVQRLEEREKAQLSAEQQRKLKRYTELKNLYRSRLDGHLRGRLNPADRMDVEVNNHLLSILGLEKPLAYQMLDTSEPATELFAHGIALRLLGAGTWAGVDEVFKLGPEFGESLPSAESVKSELMRWKAAFDGKYGVYLRPPQGYEVFLITKVDVQRPTERQISERKRYNPDSDPYHVGVTIRGDAFCSDCIGAFPDPCRDHTASHQTWGRGSRSVVGNWRLGSGDGHTGAEYECKEGDMGYIKCKQALGANYMEDWKPQPELRQVVQMMQLFDKLRK